jgi:hypothetical protein
LFFAAPYSASLSSSSLDLAAGRVEKLAQTCRVQACPVIVPNRAPLHRAGKASFRSTEKDAFLSEFDVASHLNSDA